METKVMMLLLGGLKLNSGRGAFKLKFTLFNFHEIDVPLFCKELARVTDLGSRWSGCGWR
eukprot:1159739-Pelagomonas_calceolata.AAC.11